MTILELINQRKGEDYIPLIYELMAKYPDLFIEKLYNKETTQASMAQELGISPGRLGTLMNLLRAQDEAIKDSGYIYNIGQAVEVTSYD